MLFGRILGMRIGGRSYALNYKLYVVLAGQSLASPALAISKELKNIAFGGYLSWCITINAVLSLLVKPLSVYKIYARTVYEVCCHRR
jgi:hypothetical protein